LQGFSGRLCVVEWERITERKDRSMTGYSEAQRRASLKYKRTKVDNIQIVTPKGEREKIKAAAAAAGQSLSQYVLQAVHERMEREEK